MNITIVGGGPAGLYFAILARTRGIAERVLVHERNPRDNTFGWGVVFSDRTLSYLKESDAPTHDAIVARFKSWDNVDIVHRGEKVTVRGNRFTGIARIALLDILQRRAAEVGVEIRYESNVLDPEPLRAGCDLLVGADGVMSVVKARFRDAFRPSFDVRSNRYIWYGAEKLFHGLTLTFRAHPTGCYIAHSYKFDDRRSTFIVEVDAGTWERAGLARMGDAETRALLSEVFRDDLDGAALLSNRSAWIQFAVVRCARWSHENVVLLGDALHTVHFSIGSGTKLALEDAIALADALGRRAASPRRALEDFERARRPAVEDYQAAAEESLLWFERAHGLMHLAPLPFAFSCMTRSGKIDIERLRRRDPAFVAAWEAQRAP